MSEENVAVENEKQKPVVDRLVGDGWRINLVGTDGTVYLSRRGVPRFQTVYCQVDPDGEVR